MARVDGRRQSPHKPSLAIAGDVVLVGMHGLVDVPIGTRPGRGLATVGTAVAVSVDGGATFGRPVAVGRGRWDLEGLSRHANRAGLRDRMEAAVDGTIIWAFADGRGASPGASAANGRSRILVARIVVPPRPPAAAVAQRASITLRSARSSMGASDRANVAVKWWSSR
jgi:hypothetical protein